MIDKDKVIKDLNNTLLHCHNLYAKYSEDQPIFTEINHTAKDAIELIKDTRKQLEFEKDFNGFLCEALVEKRKVYDEELQSKDQFGEWILCSEKLPEMGEDIILYFKDTYHTHLSWPETNIKSAWRCNINEITPNGQWAINGRLWRDTVLDIEDGIAWMPMPTMEDNK